MVREDSSGEQKMVAEGRMEVTQKELAGCLGISPRQVRNLKQNGMFELPPGKKSYTLERCVPEYIRFKIDDELGRRTSIDKEKVSAEHEEVKKQISIMKLRRLRKELHEASDVEEFLSDMLVAFKNRLLSLPTKMAMQVAGLDDVNEIIDKLTGGVREALDELSEYDPEEIDGSPSSTNDDPCDYEEGEEDEEDSEMEE